MIHMWNENMLSKSQNAPSIGPKSTIEDAIESFKRGDPILLHDADNREDEVDLVYPARTVSPSDVARLRNEAGGLICVALAHEVAEAFDLPFLDELITHPVGEETNIEYDERSSFSLTVNHRETYTGITDNDRAKTISTLGKAAEAPDRIDFSSEFDAPGHVHLLKAAPGLLEDRQGHTELGVALAKMANLPPAVVVCEMLDDQTGGALSMSNAVSYANEQGFVLLDGAEVATLPVH